MFRDDTAGSPIHPATKPQRIAYRLLTRREARTSATCATGTSHCLRFTPQSFSMHSGQSPWVSLASDTRER